jgi:hypothetical protein
MRYWLRGGSAPREALGWSETDLVCELLRMRARLHRLDIATALLLTEIESGAGDEEPSGGLVDPRCRRGAAS